MIKQNLSQYVGFFTKLPQVIAKDQNLSLKDLGLITYIFSNRIHSKTNKWQLYQKQVIKHFQYSDSAYHVRSAFKDIENLGYLKRIPNKGKNGLFTNKSSWQVFSEPYSLRNVDGKRTSPNADSLHAEYQHADIRRNRMPACGHSTSNKIKINKIKSNKIKKNHHQKKNEEDSKTNIESKDRSEILSTDNVSNVKKDPHSKTRPTEPYKLKKEVGAPTSTKLDEFSKYDSHHKALTELADQLKLQLGVNATPYSCHIINSWLKHYTVTQITKGIAKAKRSNTYANHINYPLSYIDRCLSNQRTVSPTKSVNYSEWDDFSKSLRGDHNNG